MIMWCVAQTIWRSIRYIGCELWNYTQVITKPNYHKINTGLVKLGEYGMLSERDMKLAAVIIISFTVAGGVVGYLVSHPLVSPNESESQSGPVNLENLTIPYKTFADYVNYERNYSINAPQYAPEENLTNVVNLEDFVSMGLSKDAIQYLHDHYFYANPSMIYTQFYVLYQNNHDHEIPSFVTVDSVLHAYHTVYDVILRRTEEDRFRNLIHDLSLHMTGISLNQYHQLTKEPWRTAALKNAALFSVAVLLTNSSWTVPKEVRGWATKMYMLINSASEYCKDWFMNQMIDFTQFIPRGHYTKSEALKQYFQTMMLFGQVSFRLHPADGWLSKEQNIERGHNETAQAILLTLALYNQSSILFTDPNGAAQAWSTIYDTTSFFVGQSDDLTPFEYRCIMEQMHPTEVTNALEAQTNLSLDAFIDVATRYRNPRILGSFHDVTVEPSFENATKGMRFMGQRYIPDSYIMSELVYNRVSNESMPRLFPKGLDVMAVLGSERAWDLLQNETVYENYESKVMALREEFGNLSIDTWTQNLYWLWLYSLKPLLRPISNRCPSFMQDPGWKDKQLVTALGSWTELRHDTVLYTKQSSSSYYYASPHVPPGYVEPVPSAYARLASLCDMMETGLTSRGILTKELNASLESFRDLLLRLRDIAIKELQNEPYTESENTLLEHIGEILADIEGIDHEGGDASLVVDVHTDPNTKQVLEEATGNPMLLYVIVPTPDGRLYLTRGAMYSYYEFTMPISQRLTDNDWRHMVYYQQAPPMPAWTASFVKHFGETAIFPLSTNQLGTRNILSTNSFFMPAAIVSTTFRLD